VTSRTKYFCITLTKDLIETKIFLFAKLSTPYTFNEIREEAQSVQWLEYGRDSGGSILGRGRDLSLRHRVQTGSGAHPASYTMGTVVLTPEIKRQGRKATDSPPPTAKIKNAWRYTYTAPIRLHGVVFN